MCGFAFWKKEEIGKEREIKKKGNKRGLGRTKGDGEQR